MARRTPFLTFTSMVHVAEHFYQIPPKFAVWRCLNDETTLFMTRYRFDFREIGAYSQGHAAVCPHCLHCLTMYFSREPVQPKWMKRENG